MAHDFGTKELRNYVKLSDRFGDIFKTSTSFSCILKGGNSAKQPYQ